MPGKSGFGATLGYSDTSSGTYTTVAQITKIGGPKYKADVIDVTSLDSPSRFREKVAGLSDGGDMTLDINFDDLVAGHASLLALLGTVKYWKITFPVHTTGSTAIFQGFLTAAGLDIPHDNKMTMTVTVTITSVVTFAAGT